MQCRQHWTVRGVWLFRAPLQELIRNQATLANDAPNSEVVANMIEQAADPRAALLAAWNSGKIVHREVAIGSLRHAIPNEQPLPSEFESLVRAGALDPDMNMRETALGILRERMHPALAALAAEQLKDPDQQVRLLGASDVASFSRDNPCNRNYRTPRTGRRAGYPCVVAAASQ